MSSILKVDTIQNTGGNNLITTDSNTTSLKNPNGTTGLSIDSAGRMLTPARPAFHAKKSGSAAWQSLGGTSQVTIPFDSTNYNVGGHYNTSNYRFVVPVAGIYFFHAQIYHDANSYFQVRLKLNGNDRVFSQNREQGTTKCATISYQFAVNDYVEVTGLTSNSDSDDWYSASTYSYFCGHLVG